MTERETHIVNEKRTRMPTLTSFWKLSLFLTHFVSRVPIQQRETDAQMDGQRREATVGWKGKRCMFGPVAVLAAAPGVDVPGNP